MRLIKADGKKMALKFSADNVPEGLSFLCENEDFIQVGTWRYKKGKRLLNHTHNFVNREANRTQEYVYVVKGSLKAFVCDEHEQLLEEVILNPNEGLVFFAGGHGYEILQDETVVIEVKNGPYLGAEVDRRRFKE